MLIKNLNDCRIEEIVDLSIKEYKEECYSLPELPKINFNESLFHRTAIMIKNNPGVVALNNKNDVIGFISGYSSIDNFFGNCKGFFSPVYGHASSKENRIQINTKLYQALARILVDDNVYSHAVSIYAHNEDTVKSFFINGFGMRCSDAIATIENDSFKMKNNTQEYEIREISINEISSILNLKNALLKHINNSPTFMLNKKIDLQDFISLSEKRKSRFFTLKSENRIIGYLELGDKAETFVSEDPKTLNIVGAFLLPEFRGKGLYSELLCYTMNELAKENYLRCGVDFESINPTANHFWLKYFKPYTYSLTRRIDERTNSL